MAYVMLEVGVSLETDEGLTPHRCAEIARQALAKAGLSVDVQIEEHPGVECGDCEASPTEHVRPWPRKQTFRGMVTSTDSRVEPDELRQ